MEIKSNCSKCKVCPKFDKGKDFFFKCSLCNHNLVFHNYFDETDHLIKKYLLPSEIIQGIYMGCYKSAINYDILNKYNIKYIINCAFDPKNSNYIKFEKIKYYLFNLDDDPSQLNKIIDIIIKFIDEGLENGNILVHCMRGINRSGSVIMNYLMKKYDLSYETSFQILKNGRPFFSPNDILIKELTLQ